jgi:hypothetical protein
MVLPSDAENEAGHDNLLQEGEVPL